MRIINKLKAIFKYCNEFGIQCYVSVVLTQLFPYDRKDAGFSWRLLQHKHRVLLDYLTKHYYIDAEKCKQNSRYTIQTYQNCIWTAWLQGEENAPEVIQLTIASMRKNSNGHKVIVLTDANLENYISVPKQIKEKYMRGSLGKAHYADVVRMMILAKYGGLWLDATMLLFHPIDEVAFTNMFYSYGFEKKKTKFVADYRWIIGIIGSCSNSLPIAQISRMLNAYWEDHDEAIDYFVFDYLIAILYEQDSSFKSIVDSLPHMKYYTNILRTVINCPFDPIFLDKYLCNNQLHYLTYKAEYKKMTLNGEKTLYGYLCDMFITANMEREND